MVCHQCHQQTTNGVRFTHLSRIVSMTNLKRDLTQWRYT